MTNYFIPAAELPPELLAKRRRDGNRRNKLRQMGKPCTVYDWEFAQVLDKVKAMRDAGMTQQDMERACGGAMSSKSFSDILCGDRLSVYRDTYNAIMAMEFRQYSNMGARTPTTGATRRLQALRAAGFPIKSTISEMAGLKPPHAQRLSLGKQAFIFYSTHQRIKEVYEKLSCADPADYGVSREAVQKAATWALKAGFAPPHCWDDDTIDDPSAVAEWTGACGTHDGYNIHRRDGIPLCDPCRLALNERRREQRAGEGVVAQGYRGRERAENFNADTFKMWRERAGLSYRQLGIRTGIDGTVFPNWERGKSKPSTTALTKACAVLGINMEDVCDGEI